MKTKCKQKVTQCRTFVNFSVLGGGGLITNIENTVTGVHSRLFLRLRNF